MKISTILRKAAKKHLWNGVGEVDSYKEDEFSCCAIEMVLEEFDWWDADQLERQIRLGLKEMGVDTSSLREFTEIPYGPERQGARYAWLMFAADIAEEQGV